MSARPFYEMTYHRKDYRLSDAMRPNPGWGRRVFTAPLALLGEHTEEEALAATQADAPEGYRLTELSIYPVDGERRIIWSTPPVQRQAGDSTNTGETA